MKHLLLMFGVGLLVACGGGVGEEPAVEPGGDVTATVTELSQQASELRLGMTTEEVLALLGPPSWAVTSEDSSEYSGLDLPLLLIWKNGNCNPVEVEFSVVGEALGWNEGRALCGDAEYAFLPEEAFACPRIDSQFVISALSDVCASDAEQVDAAPQADALSGWDHY